MKKKPRKNRDQVELRFTVLCFWCKRLCRCVQYRSRDNLNYFIVDDREKPFYAANRETGFKLEYFCSDCRGVFVGFSERKSMFDSMSAEILEDIKKLKGKDKISAMLQLMSAQSQFEIYGELSALSHAQKEMLKIQQEWAAERKKK